MSNPTFEFRFNNRDMFKIIRKDTGEESAFTHYRGIAVLSCSDGRHFIAVSAYFGEAFSDPNSPRDGVLPCETVMEVSSFPTTLVSEQDDLIPYKRGDEMVRLVESGVK